MVFYNDVGQWVYGYLAIATTIVLVFYILWYRAFKNSGYIFNCAGFFLLILFWIISIAIGVFFYEALDEEFDLILSSFVVLPVVAVSFSAFFGIWLSNDFHGYESDFIQGRNFKLEEIEAYNKLSWWGKINSGAWKPNTRKDWVFFLMIVTNIVSIITYLFVTIAMFKPVYVGVTIAMLILVFEMSFIMVWKYRATNYQM